MIKKYKCKIPMTVNAVQLVKEDYSKYFPTIVDIFGQKFLATEKGLYKEHNDVFSKIADYSDYIVEVETDKLVIMSQEQFEIAYESENTTTLFDSDLYIKFDQVGFNKATIGDFIKVEN